MTASINASTSSGVVVTSDTSGNLDIQSGGTTKLSVTSSGVSFTPNGTTIVSGTAVASTSGTSIDFTSIPSWVKRITVLFNNVSTNGTSTWLIQIGTSGTPTTTGYTSAASFTGALATSTVGFLIYNNVASAVSNGAITLSNISGNDWVASGVTGLSGGTTSLNSTTGSLSLGGVLNMVRITTTGGTDTFDAGSINVLYE